MQITLALHIKLHTANEDFNLKKKKYVAGEQVEYSQPFVGNVPRQIIFKCRHINTSLKHRKYRVGIMNIRARCSGIILMLFIILL